MSTAGSDHGANWASSEHYQSVPKLARPLPDGESFGDSGDVFDHNYWRDFFLGASTSPDVIRQISKVGTQVMFRAMQLKMEFKGKIINYSINTDSLVDKFKNKYKMTGSLFQLSIFLATESSRVDSRALTIERFKCVARPIMVPEMMKARRLPATSSSIGFDKMALDLQVYAETKQNVKRYNINVDESNKKEPNTEKHIKKILFKDLNNRNSDTVKLIASSRIEFLSDFYKIPVDVTAKWDEFISKAKSSGYETWINIAGLYSASISQKEVYEEDEKLFPGTIFWAGVHALMTDISLKKKAEEVTIDQQTKFLHSNFYGDFKKKQTNRGIMITKSSAYLKALADAVPVMSMYIRSGSNVTAQESLVMEALMKSLNEKVRAHTVDLELKGVLAATGDAAKRNLDIQAQKLLDDIEVTEVA